MATIILETTNYPDVQQTYTLEGENYIIRFRYNERAGSWFMSMAHENGDEMISGRKVVVSWPLSGFREVGDAALPGILYASDTSAADIEPDLETFGTRVLVKYQESDS